MNISILGAGAWGTALAIHLSARHRVTLWTRSTTHLAELTAQGVNQRYLPEQRLPDSIRLTAELDEALKQVEVILVVVPVAGLREILEKIAVRLKSPSLILGCKGFESGSAKLPHQVAQEVYSADILCGVLSGPSFAQEVAMGLPTALTLASRNGTFARFIAGEIHASCLRVYSSHDVVGVETGGALKNVIAIAAGISDGMAFGSNARAALITRGLAEITRLGIALGGYKETFMGLTGVGDLILTCTGNLSRNRQVGMMLADGQRLADILPRIGHVTEGVYTVREAYNLGQQMDIEMPITQAVYSILYEGVSVKNAVKNMLNREPRAEIN
jgi:glycerol-3-phosphate dehydrogenase (NAD(P)+)